MRIIYVLICVALVFSINAQTYKSEWNDGIITIDGKNNDWPEHLHFYNKDARTMYHLKNDSTYLYIHFIVRDRDMQMKYLTAGFDIKFIVQAKPKIKAVLHFTRSDMQRNHMMPGEKLDPETIRDAYLLSNNIVEREGFYLHNTAITIGENKKNEISIAVDWNNENAMLFEIAIPLGELFGDNFLFASILTSEIIFKTIIKALEKPEMNGERPNMDEEMQGGMNAPPGGMNKGGGIPPQRMNAPGNKQEMIFLTQEQLFKHKFILSIGEE